MYVGVGTVKMYVRMYVHSMYIHTYVHVGTVKMVLAWLAHILKQLHSGSLQTCDEPWKVVS